MTPRPPLDVDGLRETLLAHARTVIARDGVDGLTMRALATEAGMAVGMSYKAFPSREELLRELTWRSLRELARALDDWAVRPGGDLGDRLLEFSDLYAASDAPLLVAHLGRLPGPDRSLHVAVDAGVTRSWAAVMTEFLAARQRDGDLRADVDVEAFGFLLGAAMHHVMVAEEPFPAPDRATLTQYVAAVAAQLTVDDKA
ncbi:TetR/AcrR family transcriptional regulator [Cellulomonas sp. Leaf334]|uniref:TetR/AcrR family transcriptional regulator n=1 Tax=Cellulomonas sp. Leaf334 TaxID=1736339 RepID=UPI000AAE32BE|nr:TetR/AcrR family transcriptional regulator [Cellulomonas sp. Leaf334]